MKCILREELARRESTWHLFLLVWGFHPLGGALNDDVDVLLMVDI